MNQQRNALAHVITDFGQDYNAGIVQHLITLYMNQLANTNLEGTINYVVYGPAKEFDIVDGAYKTLFASNNINLNKKSETNIVHGLLIVIDPTVGEQNGKKNRNPIAFKLKNGVFGVAPDNGVITKLIKETGLEDARYIDQDKVNEFTLLGKSINCIWDGYYTYSAALSLLLATRDLDSIGEVENISSRLKELELSGLERKNNEYFARISGTDHNGNVTLDVNIFEFNDASRMHSFKVYQEEDLIGEFYLKGSYVPHEIKNDEGNSLVAISNPRLDHKARLELALSNRSLIKYIHKRFSGKILLSTGCILKLIPAYNSNIREDFKNYFSLQESIEV